jgi:tetratricopeptide (TPR) repeat protein
MSAAVVVLLALGASARLPDAVSLNAFQLRVAQTVVPAHSAGQVGPAACDRLAGMTVVGGEPRLAVGSCYLAAGDALSAVTYLAETADRRRLVLSRLGEAAYKLGDVEAARAAWETSGVLDEYAARLRLHAYEVSASGDMAAAVTAWWSILDLDANDGLAHSMLAGLYWGANDWEAAAAALRRAVDTLPEGSFAYHFAAGRLYFLDERWQLAIRELELASLLDPSAKWAHFHLATAYRRAGRIREGVRTLQLYVQSNPWSADGCRKLAEMEEVMGSSAMAGVHLWQAAILADQLAEVAGRGHGDDVQVGR